jgi:hemolysin activation/secretion protein
VNDVLPVHATLETDNRYSANTAKLRTTGELRYDNLFQRGQSISIQYQVAPTHPANAQVWSLSYVIPTAGNQAWAFYAVHSDSNIAAVGDVNVIGKGNIFGARLISTLPTQDRSFYHSFTAGVDYKDLQQNILLQSTANTIASPAKYPAFTAQYSATWLGAAPPKGPIAATTGGVSNTVLDAGVSFIIRGVGTNRQDFVNRRAGAGPSYFIFRPGIERQQVLPGRWSLIGKVDGQIASGPLLNSEQYSGGGADSVRGYTESERLADEGVRGSLELRTPQLLGQDFPRVDRSYALLFAEGAHLRVVDPLPQQEYKYTLASAGLGLRFRGAGFSVSLDGARILKDGSVTLAGRYRGLFQVSFTY